jgi:hypothetical protein
MMNSKTIQIDHETWESLYELANQRGESMQSTLAYAVEVLRRQYILEETNAVYAELKANPKYWQEEQEERHEWDTTLADGLNEA